MELVASYFEKDAAEQASQALRQAGIPTTLKTNEAEGFEQYELWVEPAHHDRATELIEKREGVAEEPKSRAKCPRCGAEEFEAQIDHGTFADYRAYVCTKCGFRMLDMSR
jgi:DNA-directed RNA polymerase subunit M/transcription elongation factor TFIIS